MEEMSKRKKEAEKAKQSQTKPKKKGKKKERLNYKGSNLIGYRVPGGFWVKFFHKKPPIQP